VSTVVPLHSIAVWTLLFAVLAVLAQVERGDASPAATGRGRLLVGAVVAQGSLGYLQYFTDVPEGLVGLHVLGSVLVWVAVLRFHLGLREPLPDPLDPAPALAPFAR
jgi:cytochrome c oxidase assembly protein subunit 15